MLAFLCHPDLKLFGNVEGPLVSCRFYNRELKSHLTIAQGTMVDFTSQMELILLEDRKGWEMKPFTEKKKEMSDLFSEGVSKEKHFFLNHGLTISHEDQR